MLEHPTNKAIIKNSNHKHIHTQKKPQIFLQTLDKTYLQNMEESVVTEIIPRV